MTDARGDQVAGYPTGDDQGSGGPVAGEGPAGHRPAGGHGAETRATASAGRVRLLAGASVLALLVQFLLGTATSLWVTIPHRHPWTGASPAALLWAHVVVGVALLGNAFMLVGRAARVSGDSRVLGSASLSLAGVLGALAAGMSFVGGGQGNGASMAMAAGFAVAVAGAAGVLWLVPRQGPPTVTGEAAREGRHQP